MRRIYLYKVQVFRENREEKRQPHMNSCSATGRDKQRSIHDIPPFLLFVRRTTAGGTAPPATPPTKSTTVPLVTMASRLRPRCTPVPASFRLRHCSPPQDPLVITGMGLRGGRCWFLLWWHRVGQRGGKRRRRRSSLLRHKGCGRNTTMTGARPCGFTRGRGTSQR